jgi:hypothetical protein
MKASELPSRHQDTAIRKALRRAELVRYWWEYRSRLRELLRLADPSGTVRLDGHERSAVRDYWRRFGVSYVNQDWYRLFKALTGTVNPQHIPEETFRTRIEPMLCRRDVSAAYHDKNQLDRLLPEVERPRTILRNIYGAYADEQYRPLERTEVMNHLANRAGGHFLKPAISGTGSGHNVARVELEAAGFRIGPTLLSLDDVERTYVQDFVVQEGVRQHASLAAWHPASLNTLRVITLRLDGRIRPVAATLRVGNGSHVDNGHAGGLLCGVNVADGVTTPFAVDVFFRRFARHPLSGEAFDGRAIIAFGAVTALALRVHSRLPYFDVASCDIAVTEDASPCLVEVNTFGQGVEPHQFLKGRPLFDDDTDAVLALVARRSECGWNR